MLSAAQLLDELMGRDRNLAPDEKRSNVRWDDETKVCRYYLCGFCPAELFTNTRSDLGPCEKIHDENLRITYEKSSRFMKEGYERDFLRYLQSLLAEVERRIRRGHARLALSQAQQNAGGPGPTGKNDEKGQVLTEKIEDLVLQIEELGSEGRVEEAQGMMKLVEQLKDERELITSTPSTIESFAAQEKQMEVCEVCGAFLIVGDAQSRVDDHLMGKQHMGYAKIKSTVEELKEKLRRRSEEPQDENPALKKDREDREHEREEREKKRKEEEEKEKEREKEPSDRKRSRSRDRRRSRSRDKERERERKRSRSRDRERKRSRERSDRKHRSRSRDRKKSRSAERKSHRHRSRSKDKGREEKKDRDKERSSKDKDRKVTEERSSSKKEKHSDGNAAAIKASTSDQAQGTLGYLLEEEVEERTHPFPEPDTSLLKNKTCSQSPAKVEKGGSV
ncbi:hypothetical protein CgunFtcFv8_008669 [Champsocephalus gunnari]|uniref:Luc7-like protein 3 n=1 Tax=Champsocephalus gunnari TaxID=52237 RepID=A0AAN8HG81_CHAGU|nr:hypothetical protein CgunFtcFv8_008669 [Champsocephalus gunnari]